MEVRNIGFGAITSGSLRKGMLLKYNEAATESARGLTLEILSAKSSSHGGIKRKELISKVIGEPQSFKSWPLKDYVQNDLDLVGWVKRIAKGKKSV